MIFALYLNQKVNLKIKQLFKNFSNFKKNCISASFVWNFYFQRWLHINLLKKNKEYTRKVARLEL